ncbi:MAG: DNA-binding protein WhiA [Clostridiales bacterium]|nr:DNA-binding protein WhiA [Clostridiales bacterium]
MSFSAEVKNELAHLPVPDRASARAEAAGLVRAAGSLKRTGGAAGAFVGVVVATGNPAVARYAKTLLAEGFGLDAAVSAYASGGRVSSKRYLLSVSGSETAMRFLAEIGVLGSEDGLSALIPRLLPALVQTKACRKAFLRGLFLGAGSVADPDRRYHFEMVVQNAAFAADVRRVMNAFTGIHAGVYERRDKVVVYLKSSEQIKDMMGILGADRHLLLYEQTRMIRELKGAANRISNCDNANVDRTLKATLAQRKAIARTQRQAGGIEALPPKLREAADLRLAHPEATLTELGAMFSPPVSKSAAAARFTRIARLANKKDR